MSERTVLFVGLDPARMDLEGAPPGTAANIQAGIDRSMGELRDAGYDATFCSLAEGDPAAEAIARTALRERSYGCVVIGAGLRLLAKHTPLFEALVNAVIEDAPGARLAFNATPGDAAAAVTRQLHRS